MIDPEQVYHVHPTNDIDDHQLKCVFPAIGYPYCPCKCNPVIKEKGEGLIVVHNSFDAREGVEWANEILNPK